MIKRIGNFWKSLGNSDKLSILMSLLFITAIILMEIFNV